MCTIATAKVQRNYNCYNVYFNECLRIDYTTRFKKDMKLCRKRGLDIQLVLDAIALLKTSGTLPAQYLPHKLSV